MNFSRLLLGPEVVTGRVTHSHRAPQLSTALHKAALCGYSCGSHKMAAVALTEQVQMSLVHGYLTFFDAKIWKVISSELSFLTIF